MSKIYLPDLLRPKEIREILDELGIEWNDKKVNSSGWVVISSPFREDRKPSFSLNVNKGCFRDFGNGDKGDFITLIQCASKMNKRDSEAWLKHRFNINY